VLTMTTTFEEECSQFGRFLVSNGYPDKLIWVTPQDVLVTGARHFYVRVPVPADNLKYARELYDTAMKQQSGISFSTVCETDQATCCNVWVPVDEDERQRAMCSKAALKMSAATGDSRAQGKRVRNRVVWWYLSLRHRRKQARRADLFWG